MSLALAFTNFFSSNLGERQRQRYVSEPINSHDEEQPDQDGQETITSTSDATTPTTLSRENSTTENHSDTNNMNATDSNSSRPATATAINNNNNNNSTAVNMVEVTDVNDDDEDDPFMAYTAARRRRSSTAATMEEGDDDDDAMVVEDDDHGRGNGIIMLNDNDDDNTAAAEINGTMMSSVSLAELEEERELARRRSSACSMLAVFVLFRLWISCLQQGDLTLFLLCLLGTSWTVRWIRFNREREEELDYRIQQYILQSQNAAAQNNGDNNAGTTTRGRSSGGGIIVDRNELRMLSFQAQLSLAIMESQRHMMETGGYGRGDDHPSTPGVSDRAKTFWKRFSYKSPPALAEDDKKASSKKSAAIDTTKGTADNSKLYGSISSNPSKDKKLSDDNVDDLPHCSICLGDYEDGEALVQLPCGHLYHDSCIASWTTSHTKCPLCNLDLESVIAAAAKNKHHNHNSGTSDDSIV